MGFITELSYQLLQYGYVSSTLIVSLGLTLLLIFLSCVDFVVNKRKHLLNVPGPIPLPIFGNALYFLGPHEEFVHKCTHLLRTYGPTIRVHLGPRPNLILSSPETFEKIMSSSKHITKGQDYKFLWDWLGFGLLTSTGMKWHSRRKMLTSAFHFRILEDFLDVMNNQCQTLISKLDKKVDCEEFNLYPYITHCALDIICETAMGKNINAQDNNDTDYVKAVYRGSEIVFQRQRSPWFWYDWLFSLTPTGVEWKNAIKLMHKFTTDVINERKEYHKMIGNDDHEDDDIGIKKKFAFLDLLIKESKGGTVLTDEDIREEVDTFMFEGHDTTAANMAFTMYMMALYPGIQEQVQSELDQIFGESDREATSEDLSKMKYMEACLKESLRMYQSVPIMSRQIGEEVDLDGYKIPAGTNVLLANFALHRDEKSFSDPEKFKPERFLSDNKEKRHPYSYVPFSAGPRNCIGQKFALMEEKVVVSSLLRKFSFRTSLPLEDLKLLPEVILRPLNGIPVTLTRRS